VDVILGHSHQPFLNTQVDALVTTATGKLSMTVEELGAQQRANFLLIQANFAEAEDAVNKEV
jgi:hypothetical protein